MDAGLEPTTAVNLFIGPRKPASVAAEHQGHIEGARTHAACWHIWQHLATSNDPSAGSPTETLLRLLLPLNDQVWSSSREPQRHLRAPTATIRGPC